MRKSPMKFALWYVLMLALAFATIYILRWAGFEQRQRYGLYGFWLATNSYQQLRVALLGH